MTHDPDTPTFQDRFFAASEDVYTAIERGELIGTDAVTAALMDAHYNASPDK